MVPEGSCWFYEYLPPRQWPVDKRCISAAREQPAVSHTPRAKTNSCAIAGPARSYLARRCAVMLASASNDSLDSRLIRGLRHDEGPCYCCCCFGLLVAFDHEVYGGPAHRSGAADAPADPLCLWALGWREKQMTRRIIAILLSLLALGLSGCQGDRLKESSSAATTGASQR